jgi:hypothetical protein
MQRQRSALDRILSDVEAILQAMLVPDFPHLPHCYSHPVELENLESLLSLSTCQGVPKPQTVTSVIRKQNVKILRPR